MIIKKYWFSGFSSLFIGTGIGRFAYVTILPILISSGWFSKSQSAQLGVATLIGYLFGPIFIKVFLGRINPISLIKFAMLLCAFSYIFCASKDLGFLWFYLWRLLAGFGGGLLMILSPTIILPQYGFAYRDKVASIIFSGIGVGVMVSGIFIPILLKISLPLVWIILGVICLSLAIINWNNYPKQLPIIKNKSNNKSLVNKRKKNPWNKFVILFILINLLDVGYLPHTLFWVDFLIRELNYSNLLSGLSWAFFGLGATIGGTVSIFLIHKFGTKLAIILAYILKGCSVLIPVFLAKV